jgi:hypothetical protein
MTTSNATAVVIDHRIGERGKVTIRLASAELRLAATDGDRVTVRTPEGRTLPDRVIIETTDDGLSIREKDGVSLAFGTGRRTVQLELEVPTLADVAINTASGWIDVQGLRGSQRHHTVSGEIGLRAVGGRLDVAAVSGDVAIELAAAATVAVKTVSGDVSARGGQLDALRIQTTSGDIRVDSPLAGRTGNAIETLSGDVDLVVRDGIRVQARTLSGDLASDLPHRTEGRMGRRTLIVGDGSIELEFRSVSGDLRIHGPAAAETPVPAPPRAPVPPLVPAPPLVAAPPSAPASAPSTSPVEAPTSALAGDDATETARMTILRSLEQGELDVATALERLAALDDGSSDGGVGPTDENPHG